MPPAVPVETIGDQAAPAVLLCSPWWGVTPAVRWWADELAGAGRRVVLPDFYGGQVAQSVEEAESMQEKIGIEALLEMAAQAGAELPGTQSPWAAMGFSMGAVQACHVADTLASGLEDLVLFYGGSPLEGAARPSLRVRLHVVPGDELFTEEELTEAEGGLRAVAGEVKVYRYDGCRHWFAEEGSPGFDRRARDLARSRVIDQLGR
jgi:carboxymethylenebutenolidase